MQPDEESENPDNGRLRKRERQALFALMLLLLRLKRGEFSASGFVIAAQDLLLQAYIAARAIGRGGAATAGDVEAARADAAAQGSYLRGFATVVLGSSGITAKMIRARATLYVLRMTGHANAAWADQQIREAASVGSDGSTGGELEGLWDLGDAEHCQDCLDEAALGWRKLSAFTTFPGQGDTACLSRCKCSVLLRSGRRGFSNA